MHGAGRGECQSECCLSHRFIRWIRDARNPLAHASLRARQMPVAAAAMTTHAPSVAAIVASAPPRPFVIHLLCMPAGGAGALMPPPDADTAADSPAHAQWAALRGLARRAIVEECLAISHVVCTRSAEQIASAVPQHARVNLPCMHVPP